MFIHSRDFGIIKFDCKYHPCTYLVVSNKYRKSYKCPEATMIERQLPETPTPMNAYTYNARTKPIYRTPTCLQYMDALSKLWISKRLETLYVASHMFLQFRNFSYICRKSFSYACVAFSLPRLRKYGYSSFSFFFKLLLSMMLCLSFLVLDSPF